MRIDIELLGHEPAPDWRDTDAPVRTLCACGRELLRLPYESVAAVVGRHARTPEHRRLTAAWEATWAT